ncbi:DUF1311 domain-containing protein [Luteolibacter ambystomatis]|uniref:DUF1311 domain-containing protein n=1 Tax=Luteolibacter ambystomatis TaxID=2824561 RepID=A0A975IYP8_9BACT|nr:lysozyme inhibitor LprI family protein [Luteolibacter ambystomatis]QUE50369.1 DUF1311 domain-containing protein [Luteolibacter ambystomatis]
MKWLTGFLLAAGMLAAQAGDLSMAKAAFAEKDKALNAEFAALKKDLRPELFTKLQEDQRGWVEHRDYVSDGQAHGDKPEQSADRWQSMADMTNSRLAWLKAWRKLDQKKSWSGSYSDGRGGLLEIVEKDGKCWFVMSVVRGPTFHTGEISGQMRVNDSTGWFETKAEGEDKPTWLTFLDGLDYAGSVRVAEENTGSFHGARAYFQGTYLWTGELSAEEKKNVMEGRIGD